MNAMISGLTRSMLKGSKTPVQAFNAGLLQHRSFEEELTEMIQPNLIVSGKGDKRVVNIKQYATELEQCKLEIIAGLNVLPWKNPQGVMKLIKKYEYE